MKLHGKPIAFVDSTGYVVPNPNFTAESLRYIQGRFIYTQAELEIAMQDMNRRTEERRMVADAHYGADAANMPDDYEVVEDVITGMAGQRDTVPSFTAPPNNPRKTQGKSKKLTAPNVAPMPESLHREPQGVNLTDEERADLQGIDVKETTVAFFGVGSN